MCLIPVKNSVKKLLKIVYIYKTSTKGFNVFTTPTISMAVAEYILYVSPASQFSYRTLHHK